jgi:hypothetical protein
MTYEEMFPCRAQIIRTREGRDTAPLDDYSYPKNTGEFIGTWLSGVGTKTSHATVLFRH